MSGISAAITAPAAGAAYAAPATFDIKATASTSAGNLTSLDLYDGASLLQTLTVPAGSATTNATFTMTGVAAGAHSYSLHAHDSGGRLAVSPSIGVNVTAPPSIALSSPVAQSFYLDPAMVPLSADVVAGTSPVAKVEFFSGTTLIGSATAAPYTVTWVNVPAGLYTVTARATDTAGATMTSAPASMTVGSAPTLAVDSGIDGSTVGGTSVTITGTVQASANASVTANGRLATLLPDGRWFINGLDLAVGTNAIDIGVMSAEGSTATSSISVTALGTAPFRMSLAPFRGFAPLEMNIALENVGNVAFTTIEYDAEDDGSVDLTTTATDAVTMRFSTPGLHSVRVRVKDAQGAVIFTEKRYALVEDPVARAKAMQRIFSDMIERLKQGAIDHAVMAISNTTREQYRALFTSMAGLAATAAAIGTVTNATVSDKYAWLKVIRDESDGTHGYTIYLIEDSDGIWRIETM